jgi:hypothetical protein
LILMFLFLFASNPFGIKLVVNKRLRIKFQILKTFQPFYFENEKIFFNTAFFRANRRWIKCTVHAL